MRNKVLTPNDNRDNQHTLLGSNLYILFWIFMIGSVGGFVIEGLWKIIRYGYWESHTATIWGPFCIIYGVGAVLIYVLSYRLQNKNVIICFAAYLLAGSFVEYFTSLLQEIFFGSISWDYSSHFLNLGGRVSLKMALVWGVFGILISKFVFPYLKTFTLRLEGNIAHTITRAFIVFMIVNLVATFFAVTRWHMRQNEVAPNNKVEQIIDTYYGDEKMKELFPNMLFIAQADE